MKKILFSLLLLSSFAVYGQKPETVYSIAKEQRDNSWYEGQIKAWKGEINKDKKNGIAWTNYYMAARALRHNSYQNPEMRQKYDDLCHAIVADVKKSYPGSFEAYYLTYIEQGLAGPADNLLKAAEINPNDERLFDEMVIHHLLTFNQPEFERYCKEVFKANEFSTGMLNWGYNILSELDENAILFTCGDNDTYSGWIIQAVKNFRKDVTIVNTSLMMIDDYRNRLFKELGYPNLEIKTPQSNEEYDANTNLIFNHFFKGKRPVYVSATAMSFFEKEFGSKLYVTGLAYKYSESEFDNVSIIRRNYEKRYLLDYLKQIFSYNISDLKGQELNGMYLPSMIKLYQQYKESEETSKKQDLEVLLLKIAEQTGQQNEVYELLGKKK
ncbi:hypothetical protein [Fluviicola sp.]|uniref:hypothetical protein n=1 Tax=Fluviicola sp. TaxID=1917219 RepID=UPI002625DF16|nr:hypothetical protein [Fluviicola sp.]